MNKGGPGKCAACNHADHEKIDADLVAEKSLRSTAKRYGLSPAGLSRHRDRHLNAHLAALGQKPVDSAASFIQRMDALIGRADVLLEKAERTGQANQALQAIKELGRLQELRGKATGELDERPTTVINLLTTAEWIEVRAHLTQALAPFPDAWAAVSTTLSLGKLAP